MKGDRWLGCQRVDLVDCSSTNDEAARLARAGASHGTIVVAESQRAGRGRDGHVWASPRGLGLYFSAVIRPPLPLVDVPPMTLAIGIGLCDAVRAFGVPAQLKWPNDLLAHGKKLAGVLVEAQSQGPKLDAVIVGIGVNLGGVLPPEVAATATTIAEAARIAGFTTEPDDVVAEDLREPFLAKLLLHVERWVDRYVAIGLPEIIPAWHDRMAPNLAARAVVGDTTITGEVAGLDVDGALLLRDATSHLHRVRSGNVEMLATAAAMR